MLSKRNCLVFFCRQSGVFTAEALADDWQYSKPMKIQYLTSEHALKEKWPMNEQIGRTCPAQISEQLCVVPASLCQRCV